MKIHELELLRNYKIVTMMIYILMKLQNYSYRGLNSPSVDPVGMQNLNSLITVPTNV